MVTDTLLVEIGTEELPPKTLNLLRLSLATEMRKQLKNVELSYSSLICHATPRRLAIVVENLAERQLEQLIERKGPAVKAAYDDKGEPSKALKGFMRSCGIEDPSKLGTLKNVKGEWLVYRAKNSGATLSELLPELLENALGDLPIERRMRWGLSRDEFVRPVKWLVSLYGQDELPIRLFGRESSRFSRGHRFMSDGEFELASADVYLETCRENYVKADFEERRRDIIQSIEVIAHADKSEVDFDPDLLDEVTALVEWPVALTGGFDEAFLRVPSEVLISAMKEHQRYFHLTKDGFLQPTFITITNIESSNPSLVVSGNERVIRPRLADAAFFYKNDTKITLEENVERLGSVVFQSELGTYKDKANRISVLASYIAKHLNADKKTAGRSALLAKADLVTDLVSEFPDLQGIMGSYYAINDGEDNEVAKGIRQQYLPNQSGGALPEGPIACSVALADKIDTLTGLFGIDHPPTGSKDPYALRRQAIGVIRICIENELNLNISDCLNKSAELYGGGYETEGLRRYIIDRLNSYYDDLGIGKDLVESASGEHLTALNLLSVNLVVHALSEFKDSPIAESIVEVNKRVANILKKANLEDLPEVFDQRIAKEAIEVDLNNQVADLDLCSISSVKDKLDALAKLQDPVDRFFSVVMVMDDNRSIRNNRLCLLRDLRNKFLEVADFSLL